MIFSYKTYLFALLLLPVIIITVIYLFKKYHEGLEQFVDKNLQGLLFNQKIIKLRKLQNINFIVVFTLLVLTLSGPQFGSKLVEIKKKSVDVIIAIDCSKSMLAEDVLPNRISKSKELFASLIDILKENRIGVIAFSGIAFTQCPLTFDYHAAQMLLGLINTDLIPYPGTAIGEAIRVAIKSFGKEKHTTRSKVLILLSDGEDHKSDPIGAAKEAKDVGIRIYTIGIGNPQGEPIPVRDHAGNVVDYKKSKKGEVVMTKLDEALLGEIAEITGGKYFRFAYGLDTSIIEQIYDDISRMHKQVSQGELYNLYEHRFQYTLFLAIALLLLENFVKYIKIR
ncbi:MAG: VWA domain-containing protein [Elusimicrobiota bacterium]|nr:VWA domain-containing protein [Elusimicrobiota bacterium]